MMGFIVSFEFNACFNGSSVSIYGSIAYCLSNHELVYCDTKERCWRGKKHNEGGVRGVAVGNRTVADDQLCSLFPKGIGLYW